MLGLKRLALRCVVRGVCDATRCAPLPWPLQSMLLLKKKKYAAVKLDVTTDGRVSEVRCGACASMRLHPSPGAM